MRTGIPGFLPVRLTEAREGRGLTQTALAAATGLKVQSISHYEQGRQSPSGEALSMIAQIVHLPESFFVKPKPLLSYREPNYRSRSSAIKLARLRAERKMEWQKEIYCYLTDLVDFPTLNLPHFNLPDTLEEITSSRIEEIADESRRFWGLGASPIENLVFLLENNGVMVARLNLEAESLDAFSQWDEELGRPFVVLAADKASAARSRFDAAHELGHLILHKSFDEEYARETDSYRLMEEQAHRFASAFLLPERSFVNEIWAPTLNAFSSLKKYWKVSIATMIMRCSQLGLLTDDQTKRMWINLSRKGWRVEEPFDRTVAPEEPRLLRNTFQMLVEEGYDRLFILRQLAFGASDVEDIASLPRGFFTGTPAMQQPTSTVKSKADLGTKILNFPTSKEA